MQVTGKTANVLTGRESFFKFLQHSQLRRLRPVYSTYVSLAMLYLKTPLGLALGGSPWLRRGTQYAVLPVESYHKLDKV